MQTAPAASQFVVPVPTGTTNKTPYTFTRGGYDRLHESMEDDNKSSISRRWKNCNHVKVTTDYPANTISYHTTTDHSDNSPRWLWVTQIPAASLHFTSANLDWAERPDLYVQDGGRNIVMPPPNLASLVNSGVRAMLPKIRPQLSLLNTIAEMRDFKTLGRSYNRINRADIRLYDYLFGQRAHRLLKGRRMTLKEVVRSVGKAGSDSYLQAQFNILPLLSDLRAIYNVSRSADLEVQKLLDQEGKIKVVRHAQPLTDTYSDADELTTVDQGITTLVGRNRQFRRLTKYVDRPMLRMQMSYSYKLRDYQRINAALLGRLDSVGAGGFRPSVIWNAIPWSFVLDWFVGVSSWLKENMDEGALKPVTHIYGHLWSVRVNRDTVYQINLTHSNPFIPSAMVTYATTNEETYLRSTKSFDAIHSSIRLSGLSLKEFSLATALAVSRA